MKKQTFDLAKMQVTQLENNELLTIDGGFGLGDIWDGAKKVGRGVVGAGKATGRFIKRHVSVDYCDVNISRNPSVTCRVDFH